MRRASFRVVGIGAVAAALIAALVDREPGPPASMSAPIHFEVPIEVARGDAFQGPWRMNESEFLYVDDPTVAMDDEGYVAVAYVDNARKDVFFRLYGPDGKPRRDEPANVSRSPRIFSWLPRVTMTGSGDERTIYALWQEIVFSGGTHGGEIFFARSTDGGATFSDPINLSNTIAGAGKGRLTRRLWHNGSLDLVLGPEGTLYAAWTEYEGPLRFARSTDGGKTFTRPIHVAGDHESPARGPSLAVDPGGMIHLAWTVGEDPAAGIRVATSRDRGASFGEAKVAWKSGAHADAPKIGVDGAGTIHLVYSESPRGPFQQSHVAYTRRPRRAPAFEEPRKISDPEPEGFRGSGFPHLDMDGRGNLYVLWELYPAGRERSRGLALAVSTDGGDTFSTPAVVPGTADPDLGENGGRQGLLMRKIAVNAAGRIAVVNSSFQAGDRSLVRLIRSRNTIAR